MYSRLQSKLYVCVNLLSLLLLPKYGYSYSVLTHQAIIDVAWKPSLEPVLKKRFPNSTEEQLKKAHAHAYGGAIIQDMGYYPFGNVFFTDLLHYVRSGDFVEALIQESTNLNEYAFALGALAHYHADKYGHPLGTNKAVPVVYPDLKSKFGNSVTYEEDPVSHVKMEFGFDVLQIARGKYAPEAYHDFIGFEVSKEVLERAFLKTYGLELPSLFVSLDLAIGTYRKTVSGFFPSLTKAAWNLKAADIKKASPGVTKRKFQYRIRKTEYHKYWGKEYQKPNLFEQFLSWLLKVLPKIGPTRTLSFKPPTPEAEKLFMNSFNVTTEHYAAALKKIGGSEFHIQNSDLDTGDPTKPDSYEKADKTYAELLSKLDKNDFKNMLPALKKDILNYYKAAEAPKPDQEEKVKDWKETQQILQKLTHGSKN